MFPQGTDTDAFRKWEKEGLTYFAQLFHPSTYLPKSFRDLQKEFHIPATHRFNFLQITHYCKQCITNPRTAFQGTNFDNWLKHKNDKISNLYAYLRQIKMTKDDSHFAPNWQKDFPTVDLNTSDTGVLHCEEKS